MRNNLITNIDEQIFVKIYTYCNKTEQRTKFFETLNTTSKPFFIVIYTICVILLFKTNNSILPTFIFYPALLLCINLLMRKTFKRERPFQNQNFKNKKINLNNVGESTSYSFPSNHASSSLVISYFILYINIYVGVTMLLLALITSFSRVARGYHYPFDVLCSFILSTTLYLVSFILPITF